MVTFKDIDFGERWGGVRALHKFDNGFELSIVAGEGLYSSPRENNTDPDFFSSFEIAVFNNKGNFTREFFPEDHNDDVMGWQSRADINTLMLQIQSK